MQLHLELDISPLDQPITYKDKLLLIGSCFTEHMAARLFKHKFRTIASPNGVLYNPVSVADSLNTYVAGKQYEEGELFYLNELWNSWDYHTRFSDINRQTALDRINESQKRAFTAVRESDWIMITLGSAYQYQLRDSGKGVSNNHRAPAQWFDKKLLTIDAITSALADAFQNIVSINPRAKFLFTVSPVRHVKDGVIENNRSKARLLEAVHTLCEQLKQTWYFPSYELVMDILRDYRFYDIDFVHPNYLATQYVWEEFVKACMDPATKKLMSEVKEITTASAHRPRFPETEGHKKFMNSYKEKVRTLMQEHPYLDLTEELAYFSA